MEVSEFAHCPDVNLWNLLRRFFHRNMRIYINLDLEKALRKEFLKILLPAWTLNWWLFQVFVPKCATWKTSFQSTNASWLTWWISSKASVLTLWICAPGKADDNRSVVWNTVFLKMPQDLLRKWHFLALFNQLPMIKPWHFPQLVLGWDVSEFWKMPPVSCFYIKSFLFSLSRSLTACEDLKWYEATPLWRGQGPGLVTRPGRSHLDI